MFDPTLIEALVTAALTLLGVGAGAGIRRGRSDASSEHATSQLEALGQQLTTFAERQSDNTTKLTQIVTTLDTLVIKQLEHLDRSGRKLAGDVDGIGDAVEILVTHLGDDLPATARQSIASKLHRKRRHEVTGVITMS